MNAEEAREVAVRIDGILTWCQRAHEGRCTKDTALIGIENLALACKEYLYGGKAA